MKNYTFEIFYSYFLIKMVSNESKKKGKIMNLKIQLYFG